MQKSIVVKVENVSMLFNLGIEPGFSIKQYFVELFKKTKREKPNNDFWALKNVSFDVYEGDVVGLLGSNGAGKSTILKVVSGVLKPTEGRVVTVGNICPMIELGAGFDMELSASENVYLNASILGYSKEFVKEKFDEIVEFSELGEFMEVPVRNFSSGMIARLAFSIATIVEPEILIVDEILSVGDMSFQQKSEEKMLSLIQGGTTVLYVSHSADSVRRICNKAIWIEKGKIVMSGGTNEVCNAYITNVTGK